LVTSFFKIWTCGSSPRSGSRNACTQKKKWTLPVVWANFGIFRRDPKDFPSRLVTMDNTWLYRYDSETKQQSVEYGIGPLRAPQNSSAKIRWKISRLNFLGSRRHPAHWLSSKWPNLQCGVLFISARANEGHFEGKTPREFHQGGLVLLWQCPGSTGTFNPEETVLPEFSLSSSPTIFSGSGPVGLPPVPRTEKNWKVAIFVRRGSHCFRRDLVVRTNFWIFFWIAFKFRATG